MRARRRCSKELDSSMCELLAHKCYVPNPKHSIMHFKRVKQTLSCESTRAGRGKSESINEKSVRGPARVERKQPVKCVHLQEILILIILIVVVVILIIMG